MIALLYLSLVAFQPRVSNGLVPLRSDSSASSFQGAPDATATAETLAPPTALPTAVAPDTTQSTAAVVLIWAVIIIVVAITLFLIWWTRPGRRGTGA